MGCIYLLIESNKSGSVYFYFILEVGEICKGGG